jgi:Zn-dependent protease with chaperone function
MFLTMSLASGAGDQTESDAMLTGALTATLTWASMGVILILDFFFVFFLSRNRRAAADRPFATCFPIYY